MKEAYLLKRVQYYAGRKRAEYAVVDDSIVILWTENPFMASTFVTYASAQVHMVHEDGVMYQVEKVSM